MTGAVAMLLKRALRDGRAGVAVEIVESRGSTPRGGDAFLVATADDFAGTIGGGQLEFHAIALAREMIEAGGTARRLDMPLGPFLGQCCGGHVVLALMPVDEAVARRLCEREAQAERARDEVLLFGLGHTGRAMTRMLALLPLRVTLVDDRADAFADMPATCRQLRLDDLGLAIAEAAPGSAFVIFTHSHALDYTLADIALRRADAAYVGMIGSRTKLARFRHWFLRRGGGEAAMRRLVCPIGGADVDDKRPEVIASLAAAEILRAFAARRAKKRAPSLVDAISDRVRRVSASGRTVAATATGRDRGSRL